MFFFFFFQAEDGIRDFHVTGVQTCALPIWTQGFTGAPLAVKTAGGKELIIQGESTGGQLGTRSWIGAFEVGTGKLAWRTFTIPAPGEPGSETWKDNHNAWRV